MIDPISIFQIPDSEKMYQNLLNSYNKLENNFINKSKLNIANNKTPNKFNFFNLINTNDIVNIKELYYFNLLELNQNTIINLPDDNFNIVCNKIIHEICTNKNINYVIFRDLLYDILTYNLDVAECIWYIIYNLIQNNHIKQENITEILIKTYTFFKFFNNNYPARSVVEISALPLNANIEIEAIGKKI